MRWGDNTPGQFRPERMGGSILGAAFRCGSSLRLIHALIWHDISVFRYDVDQRARMPADQHASALSAIACAAGDNAKPVS